jgi:hypothetical protein
LSTQETVSPIVVANTAVLVVEDIGHIISSIGGVVCTVRVGIVLEMWDVGGTYP